MTRSNIQMRFDFLQTILFVVAISTPLLIMLTGRSAEISEVEQRHLAVKPAFQLNKLLFNEYPQKYTDYFNDHFGLRNQILTLATWYKETIFAKSVTRKVVIGRQGWRYFNIDGSLLDFVGVFSPSTEELERWSDALDARHQWLANLGSRYLLVPIPGKMTVYSDFLPSRIRGVAGATRLQSFIRHLSESGMPDYFLDIEPNLLNARSGRQLFFKTDTHWNDDGAYLAYAATINRLSEWFPQLVPDSLDRYDRQPFDKIGDIARAAHRPVKSGEPSVSLKLVDPCARDLYRQVEEFVATAAYQAHPKKLPVVNGCAARTLKAIVVHDSFGVFLTRFLSESFAEVVYMQSYDLFGMKSFIQSFKPDVFIDFRAGRRFHPLLKPDPRILAEIEP